MKLKYLVLVMLLVVFFVGFNFVSASDVDDNVTLTESSVSDVDLEVSVGDVDLESSVGDCAGEDVLSAGTGSFSDLQRIIDENTNGTIDLNMNYQYGSSDSSLKTGIIINKSLTINGNAMKIDGRGVARIFNINADNVVLNNIALANGFKPAEGNAGGILWTGDNATIRYCTFTDIRQDRYQTTHGVNVHFTGNNILIDHCLFTTPNNNNYHKRALYLTGNNITVIYSNFTRFTCGVCVNNSDFANISNNRFDTMYTATSGFNHPQYVENVYKLIFNDNYNSGGSVSRFYLVHDVDIKYNNMRSMSYFEIEDVYVATVIGNTIYALRESYGYRSLYLYAKHQNDANLTLIGNYFDYCHMGRGPILYIGQWNNVLMYDNTLCNATGGGDDTRTRDFYAISINNFTCYNNTFYNNSHKGSLNYFNNVVGYIFNNTFDSLATSYGSGGIFQTAGNALNLVVENNTFTNCFSDHADTLTIYGSLWYFGGGTVLFNNNTAINFTYTNKLAMVYGLVEIQSGTITINNTKFINCTISGEDGCGFIYDHVAGSKITNNQFINCTVDSGYGGILYNTGNNVVFANNTIDNIMDFTGYGGVITNTGASLTVEGNIISNVNAGAAGVINSTGNTAIIFNNLITNCSADGDAGAFYIGGKNCNIYNNSFEDVHANSYGVILAPNAPGSVFYNNTYVNNYAINTGIVGLGNSVTMNNENFTNNYATNGPGGIVTFEGNNNLLTNLLINNSNATKGGAIYNVAGTNGNHIDNISIYNSRSILGGGGAIYSEGNDLNINMLYVYDTMADGDGGVIYNMGGSGKIYNSTFINVNATSNGGAIYWSGDDGEGYNITINNTKSMRNGGAIYWIGNNGNLDLLNIYNSSANDEGGAIYWGGASGTVSNLIVNDTHATKGGAVYWSGSYGTLNGKSFDNIYSIENGGAIYWAGSHANIMNINFTDIYAGDSGGAIYGTATDSNMDSLNFNRVNALNSGGAISWVGSNSLVNNAVFTNVNSSTTGGAIYWGGDKSRVKSSRFENVTSISGGGAIYWTSAEGAIDTVSFVNVSTEGSGGAIYWVGNDGNITNGTFTGITADNGGAIYVSADNIGIENGNFTNCSSSNNGGGIYLMGSSAKLNNLSFYYTNATFKAGAIYLIGSNGNLSNLYVIGSNVSSDGAALIVDGANCNLSDSQFINNSAAANGGAIYWGGNNGEMRNVSLISNNATNGGGVYWAGNDGLITNVTFINSTAIGSAGALYMGGLKGSVVNDTVFINSTVRDNGGVIYWSSDEGVLTNSTIINSNAISGGAIYWAGSEGNIINLSVTNVSAIDEGGVLYVSGSDVSVDTVMFNSSKASYGGAVYWGGHNGQASNVSFINNTASQGGGMYLLGSNFVMINANFTDNNVSDLGGGIYLIGSITIDHANFTRNRAFSGSAIYNAGSTIIYDSVILENKANISSIEINNRTTSMDFIADAIIRGYDNFLNGIFTVSNDIKVSSVTYWGDTGVKTSDYKLTTPIDTPSPNYLYYDTRLAGITVNITITDTRTGEVKVDSLGSRSDVYGIASASTIKSQTTFLINATHFDDEYYTYITISDTRDSPRLDPTLSLSLNSTNIPYKSNVSMSLRLFAEIDYAATGLNESVDIYLNDEFYATVTTVNGVYEEVFNFDYSPGEYNITAHFNGTTIHTSSGDVVIDPLDSDWVDFTIVKASLPINISINSSDIHVGDSVGFVITGPDDYTGDIEYIAGIYGKGNLINGELEFNNTYDKYGVVNVLVFAETDVNYLAGICNLTFFVSANDISFELVNVSNINVGDVEYIFVRLNASDVTGNVIIRVNGVDYNASIVDSCANVSVYYLPEGTYNASVSYAGDDRYNSSEAVSDDFTVSKINTAIEVTVDSPYVGESSVINVNVNSTLDGYIVNGYVTVNVNNVDYNVTISDGSGSLRVYGLANGNYPVSVVYLGDGQFVESENNTESINVAKVGISNIVVTPADQSVIVGDEAVITINVDSAVSGHVVNGYVTVSINNTDVNVSISNGVGNLSVPISSAGSYDVSVYYAGSDEFESYDAGVLASVTADKVNVRYNVFSSPISVGDDAVITVMLISENSRFAVNDYVTLSINNNSYNVSITNGSGSLSVKGLNEGSYDVNLSFAGNNLFNPVNGTAVTYVSVSKINVASLVISPESTTIYAGDNATFNVNLVSSNDNYKVNGYITVTVNYGDFNVSISNGSGSFVVYGLPVGTYDVNIVYAGDYQFNSRSFPRAASITVEKVGIKSITVTPVSQDIYVGQSANLTVKMEANVTGYDVNGFVTVTVNDKQYTVSISNNSGRVAISSLAEGNYDVMLSYAGNNIYNSVDNAKYAEINVSKVGIKSIKVNPESQNIYVGQAANITINMEANVTGYNINGSVTVVVNNKEYIVPIINNNGTLSISGLKQGPYDVNISYAGDDVFNSRDSAKYANIVVNKVDIKSITVIPSSQSIYAGQVANITVKMEANDSGRNIIDYVTVSVNNKHYNISIVNNTGSLSIIDLPVGHYGVNVSYAGSDIYNAVGDAKYADITVNMVDIKSIVVDPDYISIPVGQSANLTIKLVPNVTGYNVNDYVTVSVSNGKQYNASVVNNIATLSISGLTEGSYSVNVSYAGSSIYNPFADAKYCDIDVGKVNIDNITVTPSLQEIYVGEEAVITVKINSTLSGYDVDGFVTVNIDNKAYNVSIKNGTGLLSIPDLKYGNYSIDVVYNGSDVYARKHINNASNVIVNKVDIKSINVTPVSQDISAGQNATIYIAVESTVPGYIVNDYVTVTVNGSKYNVSISDGKGSLIVHGLGSGTHAVNVSYAGSAIFNDVGDAKYADITVSKVSISNIAVTPVSQTINVGENATVNIVMTSSLPAYLVNGFVTVSVGDRKFNVSIVNGSGSLDVSGLSNGTYAVNVSFNGDAIYDAVGDKNYANVTVNKISVPFILASADSIYVGEDAIVNITLVSQNPNFAVNDYVNVSMADNNYTVAIINGTGSVSISGLKEGIHQLNVSFMGNDQFSPVNVTGATYVTVNKINIESIVVTPESRIIYVGGDAEFAVELTTNGVAKVNGFVTVSVNNNNFNVSVVNNTGSFKVYGLPEGVYDINVVYNGDDQFNSKAYPKAASVTVVKVDIKNIKVTPASQDIFVGQAANLTINMEANVSDYVVNDFVTVTVNGKQYNVSIINNTGSLSVLGLSAGSYDVNVVYAGSNVYNSVDDVKYASINVNKVNIYSIIVNPTSQTIFAGQAANLTVKMESGVTGYYVNGFVIVMVNDKLYNVSIVNNTGSLSVLGLNAGSYDVNVSYAGNDIYNSVDDAKYASINVNKVNIYSIIVNPASQTIYVGQAANLTVKMESGVTGYDVNGFVTVTVDGKKYNVSIINNTGSLSVLGLNATTHNVNVSYAGSDIYNSVNDAKYASIKVNKVGVSEITVTPLSQDIYVGQVANLTIRMKSNVVGYDINGFVTVTVDGKKYNVSISNNSGSLSISGLNKGSYPVNVSYAGDYMYNSVSDKKYADINVNKMNIDAIVVTPETQEIHVGEDAVISIKINSTGADYLINDYVTVSVNNTKYNVSITDNYGSLTIHGLNNGLYHVNVSYAGNSIYNSVSDKKYADITVSKVDISTITVTPEEQNVYIGKDATLNINVIPAADGYAVNGFVTVTVDDIKYNVSIVNGSGSLIVSGLAAGVYPVNVSYAGDNVYNSVNDGIYANITVDKVDISSLTVNPVLQFIYVGQNATVRINMDARLSDYIVNDFVTVTVGDVKNNVSIIDGVGFLTVSGLSDGVYDVNVSYAGSDIYKAVDDQTFASIVVNKVAIPSVTVNVNSPIYVGQNSTVNIALISEVPDEYVVNGYVTVTVDGKKYDVAIINGTGSIIVHDLAAGVYPVNLSYDGDNVFKNIEDKAMNYIVVNKVDIGDISVNLTSPIYVGQDVLVNISMTSSVPDEYVVDGYVTVSVDNRNYNVSIVNGTGSWVIPGLGNGTYNMVISYAGDNVYNPKEVSESIVVVNKIPTSITVDDVTINVGDIANIKAVIDNTEVTGNVTFIVDDIEYVVGIVDGVARLNVSGLNTSANRTIAAIYSGDYKYVNSTDTALLTISKVDGNASIVVYDITAGETETVIINLPADVTNGTITVKFNDVEITDYIIHNNVISFNRTLQVSDTYSVAVSVADDCKYYDFSNSTTFFVSKVGADNYTISIDVNNTKVFEKIPLIVNLPNDANETLSLSVDGVLINGTVDVINGVATYLLDNQTYGNHTISVSYGNEKYADKTVTRVVFVSKVSSAINIINPVDPRVAHDIIIGLVPVNSTGSVTVTINGEEYRVVNRSVVNASGLLEGNYTVVAVLAEDAYFLESTTHSVFVVSRNNVSMTLDNVEGIVLVDSPVVLHADLTANVTGSVIFNVNGMNYTVNITESDYAEYIWTPVVSGSVVVSASYLGNDTYYPCVSDNTVSFTVYKNQLSFTNILVNDIMVGDDENIIISFNATDITGAVYVTVNGSVYEANVIGGLAFPTISNLPYGTYNMSVYYPGDNKYVDISAKNIFFTVNRYDSPISIDVDDIMVYDNATIIVALPEDISDTVSIRVYNRSIDLPLVNGSVEWVVSDLPAGTYEVFVDYAGNSKYLPNSSSVSFNVDHYDADIVINTSDVSWTGDGFDVDMGFPDDATGNVTVSIDGVDYTSSVVNGTVDFNITDLPVGNHTAVITYSGDYKYSNMSTEVNFTVYPNYAILDVSDVTKYYKGSERLRINLTNSRGDKLYNQTLHIIINGIEYVRSTNDEGSCSLPLNLPSGEYEVSVYYDGNGEYDSVNKSVNVNILPTVISSDLVKVYHNDSQFYARFLDSNGNALASTTVKFNINGVFYYRTTDADGWAKLNINLPQGEYVITSYNPVTEESRSNVINVLSKITENHDIVKEYRNGTQYVVCIIGDDGDHVGAGVQVTFNINGVIYTRTTNVTGHAKLNINLPEGEYIITASCDGCTVSNKITVIPKSS